MGVQSSKCDVNALPLPPPPHQAPAEEYSKNTVVLVVEKPNGSEDEEEEIGMSSVETLNRRLSLRYEPADGDFVSQMNWADENGCKCCTLYARSLMITWSEDPRYWKWLPLQETSNIRIRVAALLNVCWLEIHGRLEVSCLTPETTYEAAFAVMMSHTSYGWHVPVNLRLTDAEGNHVQKRVESLTDKPRGQWIELKVGEFKTSREAASNGKEVVEVSLFEHDGGAWKNGLVVKGILVRPKK